MDLFGKRRIAQLEADLAQKDKLLAIHRAGQAELQQREAALRNQVEYLVRTIRDMDQEIYNMGQKTDWASQRPHFAKLHDEMTTRKVAESKRIGDLLRPQLIETYTETDHRMTKRLK